MFETFIEMKTIYCVFDSEILAVSAYSILYKHGNN